MYPRKRLSLGIMLLYITYDKLCQTVMSESKSKKHGPISGSDQTVPSQIRACDWSMLFAFAFSRKTLTHFVIPGPQPAPPLALTIHVTCLALKRGTISDALGRRRPGLSARGVAAEARRAIHGPDPEEAAAAAAPASPFSKVGPSAWSVNK